MASSFRFKQFSVTNEKSAQKVGTDAVLLGAWACIEPDCRRILDVGTGTGVIALQLAQRSSELGLNCSIVAIDIDLPSVEEAGENFAASPWPDRLELRQQDFAKLDDGPFDLIVSNPPYFINSLKAPLQRRNTARHDDSLPQSLLASHSFSLLSERGVLAVVLPVQEGELFIRQALENGLYLRRRLNVRTKPSAPVKRLLMEFKKEDGEILEENLTIQDFSEYTPNYKTLTKSFYLAF